MPLLPSIRDTQHDVNIIRTHNRQSKHAQKKHNIKHNALTQRTGGGRGGASHVCVNWDLMCESHSDADVAVAAQLA